MRRLRRFISRIGDTAHYVQLWRATPRSARFIPAQMLLKAPSCWVRGHSWEQGQSFEISPWLLEFCTCCGQEVSYRTSLDQLRAPETEDEQDHADWHRSQHEDLFDSDGAYADWDAMRDHAAANDMVVL